MLIGTSQHFIYLNYDLKPPVCKVCPTQSLVGICPKVRHLSFRWEVSFSDNWIDLAENLLR